MSISAHSYLLLVSEHTLCTVCVYITQYFTQLMALQKKKLEVNKFFCWARMHMHINSCTGGWTGGKMVPRQHMDTREKEMAINATAEQLD